MKTGKKTIFRKVKLMVPLVLLTASLGACSLISKSSAASTSTTTGSTSSSKASTASTSYFTDRDQDASYDESSATKVSLSGSTAKVSGVGNYKYIDKDRIGIWGWSRGIWVYRNNYSCGYLCPVW